MSSNQILVFVQQAASTSPTQSFSSLRTPSFTYQPIHHFRTALWCRCCPNLLQRRSPDEVTSPADDRRMWGTHTHARSPHCFVNWCYLLLYYHKYSLRAAKTLSLSSCDWNGRSF